MRTLPYRLGQCLKLLALWYGVETYARFNPSFHLPAVKGISGGAAIDEQLDGVVQFYATTALFFYLTHSISYTINKQLQMMIL